MTLTLRCEFGHRPEGVGYFYFYSQDVSSMELYTSSRQSCETLTRHLHLHFRGDLE